MVMRIVLLLTCRLVNCFITLQRINVTDCNYRQFLSSHHHRLMSLPILMLLLADLMSKNMYRSLEYKRIQTAKGY